jgi:phosphoenolpyruvate synthase/pyruvate phosphate dikinase
MDTLEGHYRDMCDIEFTIEQRKFWLLQTRIGKRTAFAEWVMAHDMLARSLIPGRGVAPLWTRTAWRSCSSAAVSVLMARSRR